MPRFPGFPHVPFVSRDPTSPQVLSAVTVSQTRLTLTHCVEHLGVSGVSLWLHWAPGFGRKRRLHTTFPVTLILSAWLRRCSSGLCLSSHCCPLRTPSSLEEVACGAHTRGVGVSAAPVRAESPPRFLGALCARGFVSSPFLFVSLVPVSLRQHGLTRTGADFTV